MRINLRPAQVRHGHYDLVPGIDDLDLLWGCFQQPAHWDLKTLLRISTLLPNPLLSSTQGNPDTRVSNGSGAVQIWYSREIGLCAPHRCRHYTCVVRHRRQVREWRHQCSRFCDTLGRCVAGARCLCDTHGRCVMFKLILFIFNKPFYINRESFDRRSADENLGKLRRQAHTHSCNMLVISFLCPRGPLVEPSISPVPSRNNFSWVHRWVTLPSDLRDPTNHTFSESQWCQLSKFGRKFKYRDKYKEKYRDKYKDRDK